MGKVYLWKLIVLQVKLNELKESSEGITCQAPQPVVADIKKLQVATVEKNTHGDSF